MGNFDRSQKSDGQAAACFLKVQIFTRFGQEK